METMLSCSIDPRRLKHIGSGTYSDVFEIMEGGRSTGKVLRLSYYDERLLKSIVDAISSSKTTEANAKKSLDADPINVEKKMAIITNALMDRNISPHYVRVYGTKDCLNFYHHLGGVIPKKRVDDFKTEKIVYQKRYNNIKIVDKYTSNLTDFINAVKGRQMSITIKNMSRIKSPKKDLIFKIILFQVFYSLLALQMYIEDFRHNDLSTNNILIDINGPKFNRFLEASSSDIRKMPCFKYTVNSDFYLGDIGIVGSTDTFYIPDIGVGIAIGDFDFVSGGQVFLYGLGHMKTLRNIKVKHGNVLNERYHINPGKNASYDAQYFLSTFQKMTQSLSKDLEHTSAFVRRALRGVAENRGKSIVKSLFPANLILDDFFGGTFSKKYGHVTAAYSLA